MSSESLRRNRIPTGAPPAVSAREQLATVKVDNEVVWVNPDMLLPFDIKLGERCNLGLFLAAFDSGDGSLPHTMMDKHGRSGLVARVVFADTDGRRYRDVNAKGIGGSRRREDGTYEAVLPGFGEEMETGSYGISDWQYAEQDRFKSEFLLKKGLRTHRTIAILKLKELPTYGGGKMTIKEARELGYINEDEEPIIQLRAYGTQARVDNAADDGFALLKDAVALVAQETGEKDMTVTKYLRWFASTLGDQLAVLHTWNQHHGFLIGHNVTLDCRITDLDTVDAFSSDPKERRSDAVIELLDTCETLRTLLELTAPVWAEENAIEGTDEESIIESMERFRDELQDSYCRAYMNRLNNSALLKDEKFMREMEDILNNT